MKEVEEITGIDLNKRPKDMKWAEAEAIIHTFAKMKFMAPPTNGLIPIGSDQIEKGMKQIPQTRIHHFNNKKTSNL